MVEERYTRSMPALRHRAIDVTTRRGHKLGRFTHTTPTAWDAQCSRCYFSVRVQSAGYQLLGNAVALNCPAGDNA